jgi:hypothetical protein
LQGRLQGQALLVIWYTHTPGATEVAPEYVQVIYQFWTRRRLGFHPTSRNR